MQVKSIAECSKGSILQYFRPSLCDNLPLRSLSISKWPFYTGFTVYSYIQGCFTRANEGGQLRVEEISSSYDAGGQVCDI